MTTDPDVFVVHEKHLVTVAHADGMYVCKRRCLVFSDPAMRTCIGLAQRLAGDYWRIVLVRQQQQQDE